MKYRELYPDSLLEGAGLIKDLGDVPSVPWNALSNEIKKDIERAYNIRFGFREILDTFQLPTSEYRAKLIAAMYAEKWSKLWKIYNMEYDPLHAYVVNETGGRETNRKRSSSDVYGRTTTENDTTTDRTETEARGNDQTSNSFYGFNSATASPVDDSETGSSSNETVNGSSTSARTTTNGGNDTHSMTDADDENWTITKTGNIGYTTPQKLIQGEFDIWKTPFFAIVFEDINSTITLSVF